jgi:hypothetical protein
MRRSADETQDETLVRVRDERCRFADARGPSIGASPAAARGDAECREDCAARAQQPHHAERCTENRQLHGAARRGGAGVRDANSAARLSQIFANPAAQNVDLSAVAVLTPQLTEQPGLDQEKGMLHLKGYFPGEPVRINFELLYQAVDGQWRLFGIAVQPGASQGEAPSAEDSGSSAVKKKN